MTNSLVGIMDLSYANAPSFSWENISVHRVESLLEIPHQGEVGHDDDDDGGDHCAEPQVGGGGRTPLSEVLLILPSVLLLKHKYSVSIFIKDKSLI